MTDLIVVMVLALVVFVVLVVYQLTGLLGRTTHGDGPKYEAFAGGEALPSVRGKYHSELFVYAALFVVFEVVTLLVAGSLKLHSFLWPLLFVVAAGVSLTVLMLWFIGMGGAELA